MHGSKRTKQWKLESILNKIKIKVCHQNPLDIAKGVFRGTCLELY